MSDTRVDRNLLVRLRLDARQRSQVDRSKTYMQWLDVFSSEYGFTYSTLKRKVKETEADAAAEALRMEERLWEQRMHESRIWGAIPGDETISLRLPIDDDLHVPWPHAFSGCALFSASEAGPRKVCSGPVYNVDGRDMKYGGEELRIFHDQTLFMAMIGWSRGISCGNIVHCTVADFERNLGPVNARGKSSISHRDIERTLWRLVNCRLTDTDANFDGPLLAYADATHAPDSFSFAFNPKLANFYFPALNLIQGYWG